MRLDGKAVLFKYSFYLFYTALTAYPHICRAPRYHRHPDSDGASMGNAIIAVCLDRMAYCMPKV